eukprot:2876406-Karenia_brevis.AAC.1
MDSPNRFLITPHTTVQAQRASYLSACWPCRHHALHNQGAAMSIKLEMSWAMLRQVGAMLGHFKAMLEHVGTMLGQFVAYWNYVCVMTFKPSWCQDGSD